MRGDAGGSGGDYDLSEDFNARHEAWSGRREVRLFRVCAYPYPLPPAVRRRLGAKRDLHCSSQAAAMFSLAVQYYHATRVGKGAVRSAADHDLYPGRAELLKQLRSGELLVSLGLRQRDEGGPKPHENYAAYLHGELDERWTKMHPNWKEWDCRDRDSEAPRKPPRRRKFVVKLKPRKKE